MRHLLVVASKTEWAKTIISNDVKPVNKLFSKARRYNRNRLDFSKTFRKKRIPIPVAMKKQQKSFHTPGTTSKLEQQARKKNRTARRLGARRKKHATRNLRPQARARTRATGTRSLAPAYAHARDAIILAGFDFPLHTPAAAFLFSRKLSANSRSAPLTPQSSAAC